MLIADFNLPTGFDPFFETQKGLAELIERETVQQSKAQQQQQMMAAQNKMQQMENGPMRPRMPPPGFNHMNGAFNNANGGFGGGLMGSRNQGSSKMLPFMQQQQQQQQQQDMGWGGFGGAAGGSAGGSKGGYGGLNDWTSMDPAIVSYRQYPSYLQNGGQGPMPSQGQNDMYLQQQQQQQLQGEWKSRGGVIQGTGFNGFS